MTTVRDKSIVSGMAGALGTGLLTFITGILGMISFGIAGAIISTLMRNLKEEFEKEFPEITIEFV